MKRIILTLTIFLSFCPALFAKDKWDDADKVLFGLVTTLQIVDGRVTNSYLKEDDQTYISSTFSWKYGMERPPPERVWAVKTIELVGCYYVSDALPSKYRKGLLLGVSVLLLGCIQGSFGVGYSVNY